LLQQLGLSGKADVRHLNGDVTLRGRHYQTRHTAENPVVFYIESGQDRNVEEVLPKPLNRGFPMSFDEFKTRFNKLRADGPLLQITDQPELTSNIIKTKTADGLGIMATRTTPPTITIAIPPDQAGNYTSTSQLVISVAAIDPKLSLHESAILVWSLLQKSNNGTSAAKITRHGIRYSFAVLDTVPVMIMAREKPSQNN
jgi:hypothetical protein